MSERRTLFLVREVYRVIKKAQIFLQSDPFDKMEFIEILQKLARLRHELSLLVGQDIAHSVIVRAYQWIFKRNENKSVNK